MSVEIPVNRRQQYLDQLVAREPSPYVWGFVYDHDKSKAKRLLIAYAARILEDPLLTRFKINPEKEVPDELYAAVIQYPTDFGKGVKSDVYVFGETFEKEYTKINGLVVELPTEEKIRARLRHEDAHAEDNYKGIYLEDGLAIDTSNFFMIREGIKKLVREVRALSKEIEFCRQFGVTHPVYISSVLHFAQYFIEAGNAFEASPNKKITPLEARLVLFQTAKWSDMYPEIKRATEIYSGKS